MPPIPHIQKVLSGIFYISIFFCFCSHSYAKPGIVIDDLAAIRDIETMVLSPSGEFVAYYIKQAHQDTNKYSFSWYVAATKINANPKMVANGGETLLFKNLNGNIVGDVISSSEILWSNDSQWICFTKVKNGEIQLWRSHHSKGNQKRLTHNGGNIQALRKNKAGSKIFFTIGRTRAETKSLIMKESLKGYLETARPSYRVLSGAIMKPCQDKWKRFAGESQNKYACNLTVWVYDIKLNVERKADEEEIEKFYAQKEDSLTGYRQGPRLDKNKHMINISPDGAHMAWIENEDPSVHKGVFPPMVVSVSIMGKNMRCPSKACRSKSVRLMKGLWWRSDSKEIIFQVQDGRRQTLTSFYGWIPGESDVRTILQTDDMFYDCHLADKRLICGHETWVSPKKIISLDLNTGKMFTIVDANPEFKNFIFTKIEKIFGEDNFGNGAHAHLIYPKGYQEGATYPLVVVQYRSGGFLRGGTGDEHPIHVYAQNGMAVLSFDTPRYDPFKKLDPHSMIVALYRPTIIGRGPASAIENMVDKLVKRGIVDPKLVGISGLSYGSTILDSALLGRNYAAASSSYSLAFSLNLSAVESSIFRRLFDTIFEGSPLTAKGSEMRRKFSLDANAQKIDTPFLLQVASREYYSSNYNYNALKEAKKPVEMYIYPDEYHIKWQPAHKYMTYSRNLDWFNFWLRGIEDTNPDKMAQYQRWAKLRKQHVANLKKLKED